MCAIEMTDKKVGNMRTEIEHKTNKIMRLEKEMDQLKKSIRADERRLFKMCDHPGWIRCLDSWGDDLCKFYCNKCGLWRNPAFYE